MKNKFIHRSIVSLLLVLALCMSLAPAAFAAQVNGYHDPAEHWLATSNRTSELDANAVVSHETFYCFVCEKPSSFTVWRTPEYTRDGVTALSRNVRCSDGTLVSGDGTGSILDGTPGKDAYYTGYHWCKENCDTCGTMNGNCMFTDYEFGKNVYVLYDCAAEFVESLDETVTYEYTDSTYHTKTTTGDTYCCFCYGTHRTANSTLERHTMKTDILPQISNGRFAIVEHCTVCDYTKTSYVAAKSVVADYYGMVDGQPHTLTVSDLSESGVRTQIRYGNSADSCTLTSAPSYTEEGQYTVYYEIVYTYNSAEMTENGVTYVWLRDTVTADDGSCACGCCKPNCGCQDSGCGRSCGGDKGCGDNHSFKLLDKVQPTCLMLGYSRYLCPDCGTIEKRDYTNALRHAYQSILVREATCETDGKVLEICSRCGDMKTNSTTKGDHRYKTYTVKATPRN